MNYSGFNAQITQNGSVLEFLSRFGKSEHEMLRRSFCLSPLYASDAIANKSASEIEFAFAPIARLPLAFPSIPLSSDD